jgi:hypothetical protein
MKPGRAHTRIDKVLTRIVDNEVQEELHWLVVEPAHFERYRNLWNRFCDEQGAPEHKIGAPQKAEARGGEGPFWFMLHLGIIPALLLQQDTGDSRYGFGRKSTSEGNTPQLPARSHK